MATPIDLLVLALEAGSQDSRVKVEFAGNQTLEVEDSDASSAENIQDFEEELVYEPREQINTAVQIGSGRTLIPKNIYNNINWKSYTTSTRKLLSAIFTREILATHSLTGNASPAFTDKPAKRCLDPVKVADVVETVVTRCNVTDSLVRKVITSKCAGEIKMKRIKMKNLQ